MSVTVFNEILGVTMLEERRPLDLPMDKYRFNLAEVAVEISSHVRGSCDVPQERLEMIVRWLRWRVDVAWEPQTKTSWQMFDLHIRQMCWSAIALYDKHVLDTRGSSA
jgi:hypothetical protein